MRMYFTRTHLRVSNYVYVLPVRNYAYVFTRAYSLVRIYVCEAAIGHSWPYMQQFPTFGMRKDPRVAIGIKTPNKVLF